jgi:hypothetical protein
MKTQLAKKAAVPTPPPKASEQKISRTVRLPKEVDLALRKLAKQESRKVNEQIEALVKRAVSWPQKESPGAPSPQPVDKLSSSSSFSAHGLLDGLLQERDHLKASVDAVSRIATQCSSEDLRTLVSKVEDAREALEAELRRLPTPK